MNTTLKVKIPKVGTVTADNISDLTSRVRAAIDENGYGASDVGGVWTVKTETGATWGTLAYNGRSKQA